MHGGWYDASGDVSKYLSHLSYASSPRPAADASCRLGPQQGRHLPAHRHEPPRRLPHRALWGADFLVRMCDPAGMFYMTVFDRWSGDTAQREICSYSTQKGHKHDSWEATARAAAWPSPPSLALPGSSRTAVHRRAISRYRRTRLRPSRGAQPQVSRQRRREHRRLLRAARRHRAQPLDPQARYLVKAGERAPACSTASPAATAMMAGGAPITAPGRSSMPPTKACRSPPWSITSPSPRGRPVSRLRRPGQGRPPPRRHSRGSRELRLSAPAGEAHRWRHRHSSSTRTAMTAAIGGRARTLASAASPTPCAAPCRTSMPKPPRLARVQSQRALGWILGLNPYHASMLQGFGRNWAIYGPAKFPNADGGICNGITSSLADETDIGFCETEDPFQSWRWSEQWLPHAAWFPPRDDGVLSARFGSGPQRPEPNCRCGDLSSNGPFH